MRRLTTQHRIIPIMGLQRCTFVTSKRTPGGLTGNGVIAIRREDKNEWERRSPINPAQVSRLIAKGIDVIVQPSSIRCYTNRDYEEAGATISEDLSAASTIISVKEVPMHLLIPDRTYVMFSHTIKGQTNNMPLLDTILQKNIRLIDYEKIVGPDGRLVRFGPYAGYAGVVDTLHGLGLAFLARGYATPFLHLSFAKEYRSLDTARADLLHLGELIRKRGLPKEICPLTIVVTGSGSVSLAAQQMLHTLPCKYVECADLERIWRKETKDCNNLYVAVATPRDMVRPRDTSRGFSKYSYYKNPEDFIGVFHETVIPYTRVLINGMYWEQKFPRLLTISQAKHLSETNRFPMVALGDITCDPMGSVEFLIRSTTIANPLFAYDVDKSKVVELADYTGKGVIVLGVDHLPAEFPCESTSEFGEGLTPLLEKIAVSDGSKPIEQQEAGLGKEVFRAVITSHGKLTPNFEYINEIRRKHALELTSKSSRRILVIGGGMCAGPCVRHLLRNEMNHVTVVDSHRSSLEALVRVYAPGNKSVGHDGVTPGSQLNSVRQVVMDVTKPEYQKMLRTLISETDVVVSLLPAYLHKVVAEPAIEMGKHVACASYVSPELWALDEKAREKNVILLTEMGLDPGIDIMSTATLLHNIRTHGGIVRSYRSACGAIPQPENSNCPMGYKFSWSPRGVLTAIQRPARAKIAGKWVSIPGPELYNHAEPFGDFTGMNLTAVPNGDAEEYAKNLFGFGEETHHISRLTLRYASFPTTAMAFVKLGLVDTSKAIPELTSGSKKELTWPEVIRQLAPTVNLEKDFSAAVLKDLKQLGLFSVTTKAPQTPSGLPLDSLCAVLSANCAYKAHERDMVLMVHELLVEYTSPTPKTVLHRSTLCVRGVSEEQTATANTVGLPLGIAVQAVLDGEVRASGIVRPTDKDLCSHVMKELYKFGVQMIENEYDVEPETKKE